MSEDTPDERTPEREAARVAHALDRHRSERQWEIAGNWADSPYGAARVCRVAPGRVLHVVGATEMAEQLRHLYGTGKVTGWALQPMPDTRTPIHTVKQQILAASDGLGRGYTQLIRGGFAHTEEVQACPDEALRGLNNVGPGTFTIIRSVLPYTGPAVDDVAAPVPARRRTPGTPEQDAVLAKLTPITRARYRRLVDGLAAASLPPAALEKIVASLNAEPAPPADPLVELLLDTASLDGLAQLYRDTHTQPGDQPGSPAAGDPM